MQKSSTDATSDHCGTVRNSSNTNRFRPSKFIASREDMAVEEATVTADTTKENCESCSSPFPLVFFFLLMFVFDGCVRGRSSSLSLTSLKWDRFEVRTRQFVRVVKETDSKSVGLCPRKFESCSCRFFAPLFFSFRFILLDRVSFHFSLPHHSSLDFTTPPHLTSHLQQTPRKRTITPHPPCPPRPSPPAARSPFPRLPSRSPRSPLRSPRTSPSARATPSHHTALPESPWEAAPAREHSPSIPPRR